MPDQPARAQNEESSGHGVTERSYKLVIADPDGEREVQIWLPESEMTVHDLAAALGAGEGMLISIDGERVARSHRLSETALSDGVVVTLEGRASVRLPPTGCRTLECIAGLSSGQKLEIRSEWTHLHLSSTGVEAQTPDDDASGSVTLELESSQRLVVHPGVAPAVLGTTFLDRPTELGGQVLNLGSVRLAEHYQEEPAGDPPLRPDARVVEVPLFADTGHPGATREGPVGLTEPFGIFTAASTLPLALLGLVHPVLAIAAFIGPLVAFGQWMDERQRFDATALDRNGAVSVAAIGRFAEAVRAERHNEETRRILGHIGPTELSQRIVRGAPRTPLMFDGSLCEITVPVAMGTDHTWFPELSAKAIDTRLVRILTDQTNLLSVPIQVDLAKGPLALSGSSSACTAMLRWLLVSLASRFEFERIALVVETPHPEKWAWTHWLRSVQVRPSSNTAIWAEAGATDAEPSTSHLLAVRLDHTSPLVQEGTAKGWNTRLTIDPDGLADMVSAVGGSPLPDLTPIGISESTAVALARAYARSSPDTAGPQEAPESSWNLVGLSSSVESQLERWQNEAKRSGPLKATVGIDNHGQAVRIQVDGIVVLPPDSGTLRDTLCLSLGSGYPTSRAGLVISDMRSAGLAASLPHSMTRIDLHESVLSEIDRTNVILHQLESNARAQASLALLCTSRSSPLIVMESTGLRFCEAAVSPRQGAPRVTRITQGPNGDGYVLSSPGAPAKRFWPVELGIERPAELAGGAVRTLDPSDQWKMHTGLIADAALAETVQVLSEESDETPGVLTPTFVSDHTRPEPPRRASLGAFERF